MGIIIHNNDYCKILEDSIDRNAKVLLLKWSIRVDIGDNEPTYQALGARVDDSDEKTADWEPFLGRVEFEILVRDDPQTFA
jgi:hypothetical protein